MEKRLSLYLELKTVQQKARILHAVGRFDYSILEVSLNRMSFVLMNTVSFFQKYVFAVRYRTFFDNLPRLQVLHLLL